MLLDAGSDLDIVCSHNYIRAGFVAPRDPALQISVNEEADNHAQA